MKPSRWFVQRPVGRLNLPLTIRTIAAVALALGVVACTPAEKPPAVTTALFEPTYRATKAIQGAAQTGVTYVKYGELVQALSTEIGIAKDKVTLPHDKEMLALFEEVLVQYYDARTLWQAKVSASDDLWKGEIPIAFGQSAGSDEPNLIPLAAKYEIPTSQRTLPYGGKTYTAIPGNSFQRLWAKTDQTVQYAVDFYYGRTESEARNEERDRSEPGEPTTQISRTRSR